MTALPEAETILAAEPAGTDLVPAGSTATDVVATGVLTPAVVYAPGNVTKLIERIEREARDAAAQLDISTATGRKAIASLAYKVARSKTGLDGMGKTLTEGLRTQVEAVNEERRLVRDRLDALQEEVRRPLTEWEAAEKARIEGNLAAIKMLEDAVIFETSTPSAAEIESVLEQMTSFAEVRVWDLDFRERASRAAATMKDRLNEMLEAARRREAKAAELARLRAEEEERARQEAARLQAEREAGIAAEAAERARRETEEKAERERQEAARRAEAERQAAERRAQAERDAIERQKREAEEAAARARAEAEAAERRRIEAEQRAERERQEAAERAERERQAAVEAERRRQEEEAAAAKRAAEARAADIAHRKRINNEALSALIEAMSEAHSGSQEEAQKIGKAVIAAIAKGAVPHIAITY